MTPARIAANPVRAWKHGGRARLVSQLDVLGAKLNRTFPGATAVIEAHLRALDDPEALDPLHAEAMIQSELLRRKMVGEVRKRGDLIEEPVLARDGEAIGRKLRANPVLEPMRHLDEQLGHTADQRQTTRKSRGEAEKAAGLAAAFRAERDARLRSSGRRPLPLPPRTFKL